MPTFYITFGQKYRSEQHPTFSPAHPDGWVTIDAIDEDKAREIAFRELGSRWSGIYTDSNFTPSYYPRGELIRFE